MPPLDFVVLTWQNQRRTFASTFAREARYSKGEITQHQQPNHILKSERRSLIQVYDYAG